MPLHEYECRKCHHRFERIQKFSDPPVARCPKCKGRVNQLLSSPAFQFKGSGWYVNDYAKKGATGGGEKASEESVSTAKPKEEKKSTEPAAAKP